MCAKDVFMCAKDAVMCVKVAAMCAKEYQGPALSGDFQNPKLLKRVLRGF